MKPRDVKNLREVLKMREEGIDTKNGWINVTATHVTIAQQVKGGNGTMVTLPRREFATLVDWWNSDQKLARRMVKARKGVAR